MRSVEYRPCGTCGRLFDPVLRYGRQGAYAVNAVYCSPPCGERAMRPAPEKNAAAIRYAISIATREEMRRRRGDRDLREGIRDA